ncbi:hypothetical protein E8D34_09830 [Nocardioides sp. GY 10113]|uniref:Rv3235 family protein n=1 Tax=Nocardioides sp. GY 10113 TaxID=2569761 RepID=UPI0010A7CF2C|nr:Rv3235 family protein [Nocardioides sp. GY 10113]TIC87422.1 hypothetical protein E8D34_09830 [Nocardioides sp. GY 10113]
MSVTPMSVTPVPVSTDPARGRFGDRILLPVPIAETQGALALDLVPREAPPPVAPTRPGAAVVPIDQRMRRAIESWARRYVQAAVEIVAGDRPSSQVVRWTSGDVYADLRRRAQLVALAGGHQPGLGRVQQVRPRIHSVHACFVTDSVVECGVHLRYGERGRAVAARFERRREHWLCTALDFS